MRFGRQGAHAFFAIGVVAFFAAACGDRQISLSAPSEAIQIANAEPPAPAALPGGQTTLAATLPSECVFKDITTGTHHTCAIQTSGKLSCWGDAYSYVLGIGYDLGKGSDFQGNTLYLHPFPETVIANPDGAPEAVPFTGVTALVNVDGNGAKDGVCALATDGTVLCWGMGFSGYPARITVGELNEDNNPSFTDITALFGGGDISGINKYGSLYIGDFQINNGGLGMGAYRGRASNAAYFANAARASIRKERKCAVKKDGTVWCWGSETAAQRCVAGSSAGGEYPEQVYTSSPSTFLTGIADVQTGKGFSCALRTSGSVHCWGNDYAPYGALGDGTTAGTASSVKCNAADVTDGTGPLTGVAAIATAYAHSCALKNDGTVWCWGVNTHGQLGDGTLTNSAIAKKVVMSDGAPLSSITKISTSYANTCAVRSDGAAFCWGFGASQQIGDGAGIDRSTPSQVRCTECTTDSDCRSPAPQSQFGPRCTSPNNLCGECVADSDCQAQFATKPFCDRSGSRAKCAGCVGDYGSRSPRACDFARPLCLSTGECATPCAPATPTSPSSCNADNNTEVACLTTGTMAGHCVACDGDFNSGSGRACGAYRPLCTGGVCKQCTRTNTSGCGSLSACDTATSTCTSCSGDYGDLTQPSCPTTTSPVCNAGSCGKCTNNADCAGHPGGTTCNTTTGACGIVCASDSDCNASPLCAGNNCWCQGTGPKVCTPKNQNGAVMTNAAPISGVCNPANAQVSCLSGTCDAANNTCGLPTGAVCGPPTSDASCTAGTCSPSDYKCGGKLGDTCRTTGDCREGLCAEGKCAECGFDADCKSATAPICDSATHACRGCAATTVAFDCRSAGKTACATTGAHSGECVECTPTDPGACGGTTPACDATLEKCVACNGNFGSGASAACPESAFLCQTDGRCLPCNRDEQCVGNSKGPACNVTTGQCGPPPPPPQKVDAGGPESGEDPDAGSSVAIPQTNTTSESSCSSTGRPAAPSPHGTVLLLLSLGAALVGRRRPTPPQQ